MRLRDSLIRRALEHILHGIAALALIAATWISWRMLTERPEIHAHGSELSEAMKQWSTSESPARAHVEFAEQPAPYVRDWLAAINATGTMVTWHGESIAATGMTIEPIPDPKHPVRIWVAAPPGLVVIRDSLGSLASLQSLASAEGLAITVPRVEGVVSARVGTSEATAALGDTRALKSLLLLGRAGWEAKFVMAALEEHGWNVDARFLLSSRQVVRQGSARPKFDPEHYSAVIALDATASQYAQQIEKYVRAGGGLIAIGEAARLQGLASLLPAVAGEPSTPRRFSPPDIAKAGSRRDALALAPLRDVMPEAVAIERNAEGVTAAAARRLEHGRVLQVGYLDTWRWRMADTEDDSEEAHRKWWAAMVSSVAHAKDTAREKSDLIEPTPLASLVSALGPERAAFADRALRAQPGARALWSLFGLFVVALLLEWMSRRLRGAA